MTFNFSKLGANLFNIGTSVTQSALTFGMMKEMSRGCGGGSIFGGMNMGYGMGMGFPGGMNMGYGMGMGFPGGMNMGYGMGGGCQDSLYGAAMMGAQAGAQIRAEYEAEKLASGAINTKNEKASDVSANQDTKLGENFEKTTKEMRDKEGNPIKDKKFSFMSDNWKKLHQEGKDIKEIAKQYKDGVSEAGKSYLMYMDSVSGNKDGKLTEEEFVKFSLKQDLQPLKEGATDEEKAEYKEKQKAAEAQAKIAFNKLDQNGDKIVDWKETGAVFAAADGEDLNGKYNGEIASEDFGKLSSALGKQGDATADKAIRTSYAQIFKTN